jgi:hypothetical protein
MTDHIQDDLEAYALGALDGADAKRVAEHLAGCEACRREAAALANVVGALPDAAPLRQPPRSLRARVLAAVSAESARPKLPTKTWPAGRVRPWPIALAGLAAVAIVLGAADVDAQRRLSAARAERDSAQATLDAMRQGGRWWYMAGKDSFAGSGGTLVDPRAEGFAPFVIFHDLRQLQPGKVLTVWLVSPDLTWARAATFRPNGRDLQTVTINMEVAGFDRCAVTVEDSAWGARNGVVVMESRIAAPAAPPPQ